jgi:F0F1-type ATP synthase membrane subunit c/vacuolar-type H+-ATPase subunit K
VAVGLGIYVAVGVGLSVTVAIGAAGADPQAVSALMIMAENRKMAGFFTAFLLIILDSG